MHMWVPHAVRAPLFATDPFWPGHFCGQPEGGNGDEEVAAAKDRNPRDAASCQLQSGRSIRSIRQMPGDRKLTAIIIVYGDLRASLCHRQLCVRKMENGKWEMHKWAEAQGRGGQQPGQKFVTVKICQRMSRNQKASHTTTAKRSFGNSEFSFN